MSEEETKGIENVAPENSAITSQKVLPEKTQKDVEREQEAQLRAKYPSMKGPGTSALLQKRLSQKTKYFDSGDYAMAKAKGGPGACKQPLPAGLAAAELTTGDTIPTPEDVPHRNQKTANRLSKLVSMS